jgi:hypothetical protein
MSWKDRAIPADAPAEPKASSWKDRAISADASTPEAAPVAEEALPELGRAEAAAISLGQGAGMGLTPIVSGAVGAGTNAVEQLGDALGLTTDSELEKQGFTLPEKKKGLEGLMEAYYSSRDAQKQHQDAAHDQYPAQSIAMNIAGAIPSTIASGGATGIAAKVLPSAANLSKAGVGTKILAGMREGAKAGALVGFGEGDAKLGEGEVAQTINETGASTLGGAAVGGIVPGVIEGVKGTANLVGKLPIAKELKTAFKGGRVGLDLSEESAGQGIKTFSEDLLREIKSQFTKAGLNKASAMEYADEVGLRVNAGENFQEVMDELIQRGSSSKADQAEKLKLYESLMELKNGPADKMAEKLDVNRAKQIQKMGAKGFELLDEQVDNGHVQDFVPGSEADKKLNLATQKFQKITEDSGDLLDDAIGASEKTVSKPVTKLIQQAGDQLPIDINKYDLENLKLTDLETLIGEVNRHVGDLKGPARTSTEKTARGLAAELRNLSEEALEGAGQNSNNANLSKTFAALNKAGIKDNVLTKNTVRQDEMVDKLRNTITAGNPIKRERMFEYLNDVDTNAFGKFKEGADFLNEFNDVAKQVKPLNSGNVQGLFGSAKNIANQGANFAGKKFESFNKLVSAPKEHLEQIARIITGNKDKAVQSYASPILKAASAKNERQKSAILYGLYQQPAFRELYQSLGEDVMPQLEQTQDKVTNQARDLLLNNDEEN